MVPTSTINKEAIYAQLGFAYIHKPILTHRDSPIDILIVSTLYILPLSHLPIHDLQVIHSSNIVDDPLKPYRGVALINK